MALVTTVGDQQIASRMNGGGAAPSYVASGTGTTAETKADTALQAEVARTSGAVSVSGSTYQVVATTAYSASYAVTEAGLLDAASGGNLWLRGTFAPINVASGDSIQFTVQIGLN